MIAALYIIIHNEPNGELRMVAEYRIMEARMKKETVRNEGEVEIGIDTLIENVFKQMEVLKYHETTVVSYKRVFDDFAKFAFENGYGSFSKELLDDIYHHRQ